MALDEPKFVSLFDYVPYTNPSDNLVLHPDDVLVDRALEWVLNRAKSFGLHLEYNGSKSQGLVILQGKTRLGAVTIFDNEYWLKELVNDLATLVEYPKRYGLAQP